MFVRIVKKHYLPIIETENVVGFVKTAKVMIDIPESEINLLRRVTLEKGLEVESMQSAFHEGDDVEIAVGNLTGLRGKLIKIEGKKKVQVELEQMGYSLLITIDSAMLQKI